MKHPQYGYEMMLPDAIVQLTLADVEKVYPAQRSWLTQVYRGLPDHSPQVQADYKEARDHLMRIGYRPASEEIAQPVRRARKGRGSY
jgi:hypothetical protein